MTTAWRRLKGSRRKSASGSQGGSLSYETPWPLSEDFSLSAYEPVEVKGVGRPFMFGIYLVDSFGNKELIYRDPDIACMNRFRFGRETFRRSFPSRK